MPKNHNYSLVIDLPHQKTNLLLGKLFSIIRLCAVFTLLLMFFANDRIYCEETIAPTIVATIPSPSISIPATEMQAVPVAAVPIPSSVNSVPIVPVNSVKLEIPEDAVAPLAKYSPSGDSTEEQSGVMEERRAVVLAELSATEESPVPIVPGSSENAKDAQEPELLELSPETRAALVKIRNNSSLSKSAPANGPAESFSIDRGETEPVIFKDTATENDPKALPEEVENAPKMEVEVKKPPVNVSKLIDDAYNALVDGRNDAAIALYRVVLEKYPKNKAALFGLGVAYQKSGKATEAREAYSKLLTIDPKNPKALNNYLMEVAEESPDAAMVEFRKLADVNPKIPSIPAQEAMIELKRNNLDIASGYMMQALSLDPENVQYKYDLAVIMDKMGDRRATTLYKELLEQAENGAALPVDREKIQNRLSYLSSSS